MPKKLITFATCNLYNINLPDLKLYKNSIPWTKEEYDKKTEWTSSNIKKLNADVWGFQELWHQEALVDIFKKAKLYDEYELLIPKNHNGVKIVCAGAVKKDLIKGDPEWIEDFPKDFILKSGGDDKQTSNISVSLKKFSRPVLHFSIKPKFKDLDIDDISIYVVHFKSRCPTEIYNETWHKTNKDYYTKHNDSIGYAVSTIRRTAEALALKMILTDEMKNNNKQVVVLGDLSDDQNSNTLNILTGQPDYLAVLKKGGSDVDLYTIGTLQEYRSTRDVYYTHIHKNLQESLDHILVSQEFYDNSRKRIWGFEGMDVYNDHLNAADHKSDGTTDHGIVKATFEYNPAK